MTRADHRRPGLHIAPRRPHWHLLFLTTLHALAAAGFLLAGLPHWLQLTGLLVTLASLVREIRRPFPCLAGKGIRSLKLDGEGAWHLESGTGMLPARLLPSSRLWAHALFLHFEAGGRKVWVPLTADALPGDEFRRLQVRLRTNPAS